MQDDKLQGILFTKTPTIDLVARKRHERLMRRMLTKKNELQRWSIRQQKLLKQALQAEPSGYAVPASRRHYQAETDALYGKLGLNTKQED